MILDPINSLDVDPRDDHRFPCACGDKQCWGFNDDPFNLRVGGAWYAADCENAKRLDAIADGRELASRADVARDDEAFNRR